MSGCVSTEGGSEYGYLKKIRIGDVPDFEVRVKENICHFSKNYIISEQVQVLKRKDIEQRLQ
jgi:hypothetical protein